MKLGFNAALPITVIVVVMSLVLGWFFYWPLPSGKSMQNAETDLVRIQISGVDFDIPVNYMYSEAIERLNQWPKAKKERATIRTITLSVLLPDLRPYYFEDDAKWKALGHGDRVEVSIASSEILPDWHQTLHEQIISEVNSGSTSQQPNIYGLSTFKDSTGRSTYFPADKRRALAISCASSKNLKSPSCRAKSNLSDGMTLEYYFGRDHLPQWNEIDKGLMRLFAKLSKNILTTRSDSIR